MKRRAVLLASGWLLLFNAYEDDRPITEWHQTSVHDTAKECQKSLLEGIELAIKLMKSNPELKFPSVMTDPTYHRCVPAEVFYSLPQGPMFTGGWVFLFNPDKDKKLPFHEWEKRYSFDSASQCDFGRSRAARIVRAEPLKGKGELICVPSEVAYPAKSSN